MRFGPEWRHENDTSGRARGYRSREARLRPILVLAVASIALAGGAGIAYAATHAGNKTAADSTPASQLQAPAASPSPSAGPWHGGHGPGGFGGFGRMGGFGGFGGPGLGFGDVLHGQFTTPKAGGGYQTVDVQRGTVTAVSTSSITVKSADGYSATYAVTSSTEVNAQAGGIGTVKVGATVLVTATVSAGTATAASIADLTAIRASRGAFGFPTGPPASSQSSSSP
jgi:hypothetical protein